MGIIAQQDKSKQPENGNPREHGIVGKNFNKPNEERTVEQKGEKQSDIVANATAIGNHICENRKGNNV